MIPVVITTARGAGAVTRNAQDIERGATGPRAPDPSLRFPTYLRHCRRQRRLSLRQVEKLSEEYPERVSNSYLAYCETGRLLPALGKLITLARVFGLPLQSFTERIEMDQERVVAPDLGPGATWRQMRAAGITEAEAGRLTAAHVCFEKALTMAAGDGDGDAETDLKIDLAIVLKRMSRHYIARDLLEEVVSRKVLDPARIDRALILLADVFREMGKLTLAAMIGREAMQRATRLGDRTKEAHAACLVGNALFDMGDIADAIPLYEKAVRFFRENGDTASLVCNMANLANCLARDARGARFNEGIRLLSEAETLARRMGFNRQIADIYCYLGQAYILHGSHARAEKLFFQSNQIARPAGYHDIHFSNTWFLREIAAKFGRAADAAGHMKTLRHLRGRVENTNPEVRAYDRMTGPDGGDDNRENANA